MRKSINCISFIKNVCSKFHWYSMIREIGVVAPSQNIAWICLYSCVFPCRSLSLCLSQLPSLSHVSTPCALAINSIALDFTIRTVSEPGRIPCTNCTYIKIEKQRNHFGFLCKCEVYFNAFSARRKCLIWLWYYSLCNPR